ncbi:tetratricopeptide repeat protein [Sphingobium sp. SA2]|uniref:tetratricopeptide repeat protein n=1 Tax=unclassified Sphingobium TaxID=2611147 RepID=UPI00083E6CC3|nr:MULTISPECIES: tetratricopeptide repeat protein [unclassified Sphingobium]AOF96278.1 thioredoxin family protein [Sphingobium sp. RAC03]MDT7534484.1 tetratricopeptide repeat protein [Sphingobium sp. SA2]
MATLGLSEADKAAIEAFRQDVVEPSRTQLVIVDFWAEWCGPCKQLTPIIEKVCADYATKGVKLVKVNVDDNGFIASQFRVQSIPTVYAVFQGQPVADLTQARTEGALKQYLDQLLSQLPIESEERSQAQEIAPLIAMGEELLAEGDAERALSVFTQIAQMAPDMVEVVAGQARALVMLGQLDEAEALLAALPAEIARHGAVDQARAAIALARDVKPLADLSAVEAKVAADPDDHEARFELAGGLMANGDRDGAADALLEIVRRDRTWNEGAARAQLVTIFEAVGLEDPWVSAQRRKLSQILFA